MGKSITSTLFALLVKDGTDTLEQPAPVPEWQKPGDPRGAIRNIDLLRMSSGLRFIATQDPDYSPDKGYPDHFYIYTGAVNAFDYSVNVPTQFPVNSEGRYRNSDPLTIGRLIKAAVTRRGEEYSRAAACAVRSHGYSGGRCWKPIRYGNFLLTGYDYGTPRNWARLGLLYLQDGMWQGTRICRRDGQRSSARQPPRGSKAPTAGSSGSTAQASGTCRARYFMAGAGGQWTFVIPSHQLVVARMGHYKGAAAGQRALNTTFTLLLKALPHDSSVP